jgi:penicillin amidase
LAENLLDPSDDTAHPRRRSPRRLAETALSALFLSWRRLVSRRPRPSDLVRRLDALPCRDLPLGQPVEIAFDRHQIPFLDARDDDDLALALGLVHAHLRLGQMEILRRIAYGRISEIAGPATVDLDVSLRVFDFPRAAAPVIAAMPQATRRWVERFVEGINLHLALQPALPHELRLLGVRPEPWRPEDVVAIGRLAGTDVTWLAWFQLLPLRERPDWPVLWRRVLAEGGPGVVAQSADPLAGLLLATAKSGSNAAAVAGTRTASGAALLMNDPHLGLALPNLWLAAGMRSPSLQATGLMIPGVPFVAIGRNRAIAWGGTNLRAQSSDLVDLGRLPPEALKPRRVVIKVRWGRTRRVTLRESAYGPVLTDAPFLRARTPRTLGLRWAGHDPSDEITAMLGVMRAHDLGAFRRALEDFGVSGQSFLYADTRGRIAQLKAARLPCRPARPPEDLTVTPAQVHESWARTVTAAELPAVIDPPEGFTASANDPGLQGEVPTGWFYGDRDRIARLRELLGDGRVVTAGDLVQMQQDTERPSARRLRAVLLRLAAAARRPEARRAHAILGAWDAGYGRTSRGAVVAEVAACRIAEAMLDPAERSALESVDAVIDRALDRLETLRAAEAARVAEEALVAGLRALDRHGDWGGFHRLRISHLLGNIPVLGRAYRYADLPADGGNGTLHKTAHGLTDRRHVVRYGAQARFVADLADLDASGVVLLGGQDGWFRSSTFLDQLPLWREGRLIDLPLRPETAFARAAGRVVLHPKHG